MKLLRLHTTVLPLFLSHYVMNSVIPVLDISAEYFT
jgi:hypothetical protein